MNDCEPGCACCCTVFPGSPTRCWRQCCGIAARPERLADGGPPLWRELGLATRDARELTQTLRGRGQSIDIDTQLAALARVGADVLPITDSRYPPLLRTIHDPPPLLYVRGDTAVLSQAQLAMVGSRRASPAGVRAAAAWRPSRCGQVCTLPAAWRWALTAPLIGARWRRGAAASP